MAGLERLVHIHLNSQQVQKRYLTLFYCFTLGLALILAYFAIDQRLEMVPANTPITQAAVITPSAPTHETTQAPGSSTASALPAVPPTPNDKTPSSLGVSSGELRGEKVSLWHPWAGAAGETLRSILAEFNRVNRWGITVEPVAYEGFGALDEAMQGALEAGTLPAVVVDYGYQARRWENSATLVDLDTYVDDPLWGLTVEDQADFFTRFWDEDLLTPGDPGNTRRLAVPYYRSAYVLFYNRTWARELGYPNPPATPEDFRLRACAAAASTNDAATPGRGGWLVTPQPGGLLAWIAAFGGEVTLPGASGYLFNSPETQQAFTYLRGLQDSGCTWYDPQVNPKVEFASRGALFIIGSLFDILEQQNTLSRMGSTDEWMVLPFPSKGRPAVDTYGPSLMITHSNPPGQLAAWLVLEWLLYPPNQADWVQSINAFPTRVNTLIYLNEAENISPQWAQALQLLPYSHSEPTVASWGVVRWVLQDALVQLFAPGFTADQIPSLLDNLDSLAVELDTQVH